MHLFLLPKKSPIVLLEGFPFSLKNHCQLHWESQTAYPSGSEGSHPALFLGEGSLMGSKHKHLRASHFQFTLKVALRKIRNREVRVRKKKEYSTNLEPEKKSHWMLFIMLSMYVCYEIVLVKCIRVSEPQRAILFEVII